MGETLCALEILSAFILGRNRQSRSPCDTPAPRHYNTFEMDLAGVGFKR